MLRFRATSTREDLGRWARAWCLEGDWFISTASTDHKTWRRQYTPKTGSTVTAGGRASVWFTLKLVFYFTFSASSSVRGSWCFTLRLRCSFGYGCLFREAARAVEQRSDGGSLNVGVWTKSRVQLHEFPCDWAMPFIKTTGREGGNVHFCLPIEVCLLVIIFWARSERPTWKFNAAARKSSNSLHLQVASRPPPQPHCHTIDSWSMMMTLYIFKQP